MRYFEKSVACAVVAWVLSSCATQVYLNKWEPAQVDLPRGTALHVQPEARGPLRGELRRAFQQQIAADGFYCVGSAGAGADLRLHRVELDVEPPREGDKHREGRPRVRRMELTADVISNYQRIYRRDCSVYVDHDLEGRPDWEEACEYVAAQVMRDLTPHQVRYSMPVDEVEGNPAVIQAAQACAAGNWEQGRALAQTALKKNPDEAEACYVLGIIERNVRNYAASDSWFKKAYNLRPESKYVSALRGNAEQQSDEKRAQAQMSGYAS